MTQNIRALLADDEPLARRTLRDLIESVPRLRLVGEGRTGAETGALIRRLRPELVFLDIAMPDGGGFEALTTPPVPAVVFVTAYPQHAVRAFEKEAVDYLLKPFSDERFAEAVRRAIFRVDVLKAASTAPTRLSLPTRNGLRLVEVEGVDWLEATDCYVTVHAGQEEFLLRRSLNSLEIQLERFHFIRIHRSRLVNPARVSALDGAHVVLKSGERLQVSRRRREYLRHRLAQFHARPQG